MHIILNTSWKFIVYWSWEPLLEWAATGKRNLCSCRSLLCGTGVDPSQVLSFKKQRRDWEIIGLFMLECCYFFFADGLANFRIINARILVNIYCNVHLISLIDDQKSKWKLHCKPRQIFRQKLYRSIEISVLKTFRVNFVSRSFRAVRNTLKDLQNLTTFNDSHENFKEFEEASRWNRYTSWRVENVSSLLHNPKGSENEQH